MESNKGKKASKKANQNDDEWTQVGTAPVSLKQVSPPPKKEVEEMKKPVTQKLSPQVKPEALIAAPKT